MFRWIVAIIAPATLRRNWWTVLFSVFLFASIVLYRAWKNNRYSNLVWFVVGMLCGLISLFFLFRTKPAVWVPASSSLQLFSGVVVNQQKSNSYEFVTNSWTYLLYSNTALTVWSQLLIHTRPTIAEIPSIQRSTRLEASVFEDEFSFPRRLAMKWYIWSIVVSPWAMIMLWMTTLWFIDSVREYYKQRLWKHIHNKPLYALLLGMTIGDRSWFDKESYQRFIDTGLVHLLAVSGSNIAYLSILAACLLFWLPFYRRIIFLWVSIVLYWLLCGMDSSVIRAVIVWLLGILAILSGRSTHVWRMLSIAAWTMLLRNPLLLRYDLWFLLSFSATSGIVAISEYYKNHAIKHYFFDLILRNWLLPTLWASIGVLPILLLFTGSMSILWIVVNLIIIPLVPVFLLLFPLSFLPWCWDAILMLMVWCAEYLFTLTRFMVAHDWILRIDTLSSRIMFLLRWIVLWTWIFSLDTNNTNIW